MQPGLSQPDTVLAMLDDSHKVVAVLLEMTDICIYQMGL